MRKAKYSAKKVYLSRASRIGFGLTHAKPGNWVRFVSHNYNGSRNSHVGRVIGRIDETDRDGENCAGHLAVMQLSDDATHAYVRWVDPAHVLDCYEKPPRALLQWITGDDWPKSGTDAPRLIAMAEHGTCSETYIASRQSPDKPYNARPEYVAQFTL